MKIKTKLLITVILIFSITIGIFYTFDSFNRLKIHKNELSHITEHAQNTFYDVSDQEIKLFLLSIDMFSVNKDYSDLFLIKDRNKLYEFTKPLFDKLKFEYKIDRFFYHDVDGFNFLRMHNKTLYGDKIERFTLEKSRTTMLSTAGFELGPTSVVLGAVSPFYNDEKLVGYIEFGQDLSEILDIASKRSMDELIFITKKDFFSYENWDRYKKENGLRNNWDDFDDYLVVESTINENSPLEDLPKKCFKDIFINKNKNIFEYKIKEKIFLCKGFPLFDVKNKKIGTILVLSDVSSLSLLLSNNKNNTLLLLLTLFLLSTILFLIIFNKLVTLPLRMLFRGIEIIEKGNLDYKIGIYSSDEIGQLAGIFNRLILSMKNLKNDLNKKVKEQTIEIVERENDLSKQQFALLNVLEDVEEEKQKNILEKDKINTILQSIGDGVFVLDKNLKVIIFNKASTKISGFSDKDILGKKYKEVLKFLNEKDNKPNDAFIEETLKTGKVQTMPSETMLIKKDGSKIAVADSSAPIKNKKGEIIGVVVVFRDATQARKIEKMKSEFVSIASHQLRTPLTGIQWVSERLLKVSKNLSKKENDYVNDIFVSSKRLSQLVDSLLNISRIEEGVIAVVPENVEIVKFIQNYLEEIEPLATKQKIKIIFEKEMDKLDSFIDRNALQNIIQSLFSNSLEYTAEGGKIVIGLSKTDKTFTIKISDTGIGIPKDDQETIFEKFTRGANAQKIKTDGTGFGLYIAKTTVNLLDGNIRFESEENKGTTFFVELPITIKPKKGTKGFV